MTKYYNGDELLSRHSRMYFVCGDRFGGKSTWVQKYVLKKAIKSKGKQQFAVLVRYDKDIKLLCQTYFDNTMMMFYPDYELTYEAREFYLKKKDSPERILVGYAFPINQATKYKSTSYPLIETMIMEEFMNLEDKYIKSQSNPELEVELLISLYASIARGNGKQVRDNCKCICISNNFFINNPYFRYYKLVDRIIKNPFQRFYVNTTEPKCVVEMTHNDVHLDIGRDDVNKGSKFAELANEIKIVGKPSINTVDLQFTIDGKEFINIAEYNESVIVFSNGSKIRANTPVFSCTNIQKKDVYSINILKSMSIYKDLKNILYTNTGFFDKMETYIKFYDLLNF